MNSTASKYCFILRTSVVFFCIPSMTNRICSLSSFKNREVDPGMLIFGEVGLSGEVRAVSQAGQRVAEAVKMGFTACVLPRANLEKLRGEKRIRLIGVENVREAIEGVFSSSPASHTDELPFQSVPSRT